ncbi:hypothetical protein TNCV_222431 [Trichonephila clavipes]|nr:hypothetical protein TNCV_222431 [Trichonephila clavipes]
MSSHLLKLATRSYSLSHLRGVFPRRSSEGRWAPPLLVKQLQRVASGLNVTPGLSTLANENYLRGRCKELKDHEKQVI